MKQWEQIAFAVALAAFGWLLYKNQGSGTKFQGNGKPIGAFSVFSNVPGFYSVNAINVSSSAAPSGVSAAAASIPIPNTTTENDNSGGYMSYDDIYNLAPGNA